jgi:TonB family protein
MNMENTPRNKNKGFIGTILFHGLLLAIFVFFGYTTPLPLPEEEGILVNFGTDQEGSGLIEPSVNEPRAAVREARPEPEATPPPEPKSEGVMTQDFEEAPAMESGKEEVREKKPSPEEIRRREEAREAEQERKRREEEKRRLEEIRRKQEAERKEKEALEDLAKGAFSNAEKNTNGQSTSEGDGTSQGNQGKPTGSVNTKNREGTGLGDEGVSFSLAGRNPQSLPKPEYIHQVEGKVVVEVTVNRSGEVVNANPGVKGSTTLDENLLQAAKKAALNARFDVNPNAAAYQKGTITYYFKLR